MNFKEKFKKVMSLTLAGLIALSPVLQSREVKAAEVVKNAKISFGPLPGSPRARKYGVVGLPYWPGNQIQTLFATVNKDEKALEPCFCVEPGVALEGGGDRSSTYMVEYYNKEELSPPYQKAAVAKYVSWDKYKLAGETPDGLDWTIAQMMIWDAMGKSFDPSVFLSDETIEYHFNYRMYRVKNWTKKPKYGEKTFKISKGETIYIKGENLEKNFYNTTKAPGLTFEWVDDPAFASSDERTRSRNMMIKVTADDTFNPDVENYLEMSNLTKEDEEKMYSMGKMVFYKSQQYQDLIQGGCPENPKFRIYFGNKESAGDEDEIKIKKTDTEDGEVIEGAKFQLIADSDVRVLNQDGIMEIKYHKGDVIEEKSTDKKGEITFKLPDTEAKYKVFENGIPYGYWGGEDFVKNGEKDKIDAKGGDIVEVENERQKGRIKIIKTDNDVKYDFEKTVNGKDKDPHINHKNGNSPLIYEPQGDGQFVGAIFEIRAAEDIKLPSAPHKVVYPKGSLVESIQIGIDGTATSGELELGKYVVQEVVLPEGYYFRDYEDKGHIITIDNKYTGAKNLFNTNKENPELDREYENSIAKGHFELHKILEGLVTNDRQLDEQIKKSKNDIYFGIYLKSKLQNIEKSFNLPDKFFERQNLDGTTTVNNITKNYTQSNPLNKEPLYMVVKTSKESIVNGIAGSNIASSIVFVDGKVIENNTKQYALPYGLYEIRELNTPEGYIPLTANFKIDTNDKFAQKERATTVFYGIDKEGGVKNHTNHILKQILRIRKFDEETGKLVTEPAKYKIFSFNNYKNIEKEKISATWNKEKQDWEIFYDGKLVTENDGRYLSYQQNPMYDKKVSSVFTTNNKGEVTIPETITYGKYLLLEVEAPKGYSLATRPGYFEIKETEYLNQDVDGNRNMEFLDNEGNSIYIPRVINVSIGQSNIAQKGQVHIEKRGKVLKSFEKYKTLLDKEAFRPVFETEVITEPAEFKIFAREDVVVNGDVKHKKGDLVYTLTTKEGKAETPLDTEEQKNINQMYLGKYYLVETKAPKEFSLNPKQYDFELTEQNQEVTVTHFVKKLENERQKLRIGIKKEIDDGTKANNIFFGIFAKEDMRIGNKKYPTTMPNEIPNTEPDRNDKKVTILDNLVYDDKITSFIHELEDFLIKEVEKILEENKDNEKILKEKETFKKQIEFLNSLKEKELKIREEKKNGTFNKANYPKEETEKENKTREKYLDEMQNFYRTYRNDEKLRKLQDGIESSILAYTSIESLKEYDTEKSKEMAKEFKVIYDKLILELEKVKNFEKYDYTKIENVSKEIKTFIDKKILESLEKLEAINRNDLPKYQEKIEKAKKEIKENIKNYKFLAKHFSYFNFEVFTIKLEKLENAKVKDLEPFEKVLDKIDKDKILKGITDILKPNEKKKIDDKNLVLRFSKDKLTTLSDDMEEMKYKLLEREAHKKNTKKLINKGSLLEVVEIKDGIGMSKGDYLAGEYYIRELKVPYNIKLNDRKIWKIELSNVENEDEVIKYVNNSKAIINEKIPTPPSTPKEEKPEIKTTASFKDNEKVDYVKEKTTIIDKVEYKNLIVGKEYELKGLLMNKSTNKPLLIDGKEVVASKKFTPTEKDGFEELEFVFDSSKFEDKTETVVFEDLYKDGKKIATHTDINDEGQTVKFRKPEIKTSVNGSYELKEENGSKKYILKFIDRVEYNNLIPEKEYELKGILMDKSTNNEFKIDGKNITGTTKFTPKEEKGFVDVKFTFILENAKELKLVVFEDLYYKGEKIAEHRDINDENQTINIKVKKKPKREIVKTGVGKNMLLPFMLLVSGIGGGLFFYIKRKNTDKID